MRALVLSIAVLMSAVASAQTQAQGLSRPPPPGQPTGPSTPQPAPTAPIPGYNNGPGYNDSDYDYFDVPQGFRRRSTLVVIDREQLVERMARLESLLAQATNENGRRQRDALRNLREEMNSMRSDVTNAPDLRAFRRRPGPPQPQPQPQPPPQPQVYPIAEDQLQNLIRAVSKEPFGDGKLRVLGLAAPSQYFMVPQVLRILQKFSFGEDKLNAVRVLWPRVLDRQNAYQLEQAFTYSSDKEKLRQILTGG
jgi:Domain of unknown function (DUF4476)